MAKKNESPPIPKDDDDFHLDLGINPQDAVEATAKGLEQGVKAGLTKGTAEGIKPLAQSAAEQAVGNLMNGGSGNVSAAIKNISDLYQTQALQLTIDQMKQNGQQKATTAPIPAISPGEKLKELMNNLIAMGLNPSEFFADLTTQERIMLATNPDLLPMVMGGSGKKNNNDNSSLIQMMLMQRQQPPPPVVAEKSNNSDLSAIFTAMIQQNQQTQQAQMQMFQMMMEQQRQASDEKMQLTLKAIEPYMHHQTMSEELHDMGEKMESLKGIGLMTATGTKTDKEMELNFEAQKMGLELKKEEMKMDKEMKMEAQKAELQEKQMEQIEKLLGYGQRILKKFPLGGDTPDESPITAPSQLPSGSNKSISKRITGILSKIQSAMPQGDET